MLKRKISHIWNSFNFEDIFAYGNIIYYILSENNIKEFSLAMIEGVRRIRKPGVKESQKEYYVLSLDSRPRGVCTSYIMARACAESLARQCEARAIDGEDLFVYSTKSGKHYITITPVKRLKISGTPDED